MEASGGTVYQAKGMANVKSQAGLENELRGQLGVLVGRGTSALAEWDRQPLDGSM